MGTDGNSVKLAAAYCFTSHVHVDSFGHWIFLSCRFEPIKNSLVDERQVQTSAWLVDLCQFRQPLGVKLGGKAMPLARQLMTNSSGAAVGRGLSSWKVELCWRECRNGIGTFYLGTFYLSSIFIVPER